MAKEISIGTVGTAEVAVTAVNTADVMGSGALPVFATPAMCALMEKAAVLAVEDFMEDGESTVGIKLAISHDAPSPLGAEITATATITAVEGRKVSFAVEAREGDRIIGKGTHERFIIDCERFMNKLKK
ncbi:thioesterase family protein [uncultured Veillonella sp.]|uniref:thioesterase family protein n=1 Tax=uncultured Veillonella sp. TaxID=159268 RepID=UPI002583657D|nr:thioesterase family protein [uncultured Veillonella sp.]